MWVVLVWIVSTICYLPLLFDSLGFAVPSILQQTKYLFVAVPMVFSFICVKRHTSIKSWLGTLFARKIRVEPWVLCGVIALSGIVCTSIFNKKAWGEQSLLFSALYLFLMATLEEVAWRGFRLESLLKKKYPILIVSLEWAIWHVPMWTIRNSIGLNDILFWLVYTALIGNILGRCMLRYKNIVVPIVLHTIFNLCFLLPIKANALIAFCLSIGVLIFERIMLRKNVSL